MQVSLMTSDVRIVVCSIGKGEAVHARDHALATYYDQLQGSRYAGKGARAGGWKGDRSDPPADGHEDLSRAGAVRADAGSKRSLARGERDQHVVDSDRRLPRVRDAGGIRHARGWLRALARVDQHPRR